MTPRTIIRAIRQAATKDAHRTCEHCKANLYGLIRVHHHN